MLALMSTPLLGQRQIPYRDYSRCLPDFLRNLAAESLRKRNADIAGLTSASAIESRQKWVRSTFWNLVGPEPQRSSLNLRAVGEFQRQGYRVEKLVYESQPGLFVSANLYIPTSGRPPYPGVLFQLGHSINGNAAAPYQKCCQGLAQLGFVVLAFEPMGQGERTNYPRSDRPFTRLRSADDEHTVPGQQMLLVGMTATQMQVWDAIRSLDVLASHPLVDPKRLASTGNSGGGTITMFLAAVDDRIAVAAPSCPNSENFVCDDFNPPGSTDDAEQNFIGSGALGFDRWDTLYPFAPKPLLILISAKDFFGTYSPSYVRNGRQEFSRLQSVYQTMGKQNHIAWWESPLPHGFNHASRMEVYRWFRRWLQDRHDPLVNEPPVSPEPDKTLWVSDMGSVVQSRPVDFVRRAASALKRQPRDLRDVLGIQGLNKIPPRIVTVGSVPSEGCTIDALEVQTAAHVWVPCWLFRPGQRPDPDRILLLLDGAGRNARAGEDAVCHALARSGVTVCAPDVRGVGDLVAEVGRGAPRYTVSHASEQNYAWASLILGQSLLGQRVIDLLAVVRALAPARISLAAQGKMTIAALFAAALDPRIDTLYLAGGLASYKHLLLVEEYSHPFSNFVPSILKYTDLPEMAGGIKAKVTLGGAVDARGKAIPLDEVRSLYPVARIHDDPAWTLERLSAF
jgi:cephalosporin-C deacetylase-like acetyl esterase